MNRETLRIIDANFNRSREGLRVCEDTARFALNSPTLTRELKSVRHGITSIMREMLVDKGAMIDSRDALKDVGRVSKTATEMKRSDYADIFLANIERVKESLRVMEEFFKLIDTKSSRALSRLRFKTYDIEKKAFKRFVSLRNHR